MLVMIESARSRSGEFSWGGIGSHLRQVSRRCCRNATPANGRRG